MVTHDRFNYSKQNGIDGKDHLGLAVLQLMGQYTEQPPEALIQMSYLGRHMDVP